MRSIQRQACQGGQSGDLKAARRRRRVQSADEREHSVGCFPSSRAPWPVVMTSYAGRRISFVNTPWFLQFGLSLEAGITAALLPAPAKLLRLGNRSPAPPLRSRSSPHCQLFTVCRLFMVFTFIHVYPFSTRKKKYQKFYTTYIYGF